MDEMRTISYTMIFNVLNALRDGPRTIDQLENACMLAHNDLRAVLSSTIYRRLVMQRSDEYMMTKKGARTAIYLLSLYESTNYPKNEYREIMYAFNRVLTGSDRRAAVS
jgi:predicted transcriptional regulator